MDNFKIALNRTQSPNAEMIEDESGFLFHAYYTIK